MFHPTTKLLLSLVGVACLLWPRPVTGHARLWEPPGRSTMWRRGYDTPANYNDNQLFCGGFQYQLNQGYRCGICGDPYDGARPNEAGGLYANGIIVATYTQGQVATFQVDVTANHKGFFEFKLCPVNDPSRDLVTQECLDVNPVNMADGSGSEYHLDFFGAKMFDVQVKLPDDLTCDACVLQFRYHTGNNWGPCPDGTRASGCGPQEEFYGCADISIQPQSGSSSSGTSSSGSGSSTSGTGSSGSGSSTSGTGSSGSGSSTSGTGSSGSGSSTSGTGSSGSGSSTSGTGSSGSGSSSSGTGSSGSGSSTSGTGSSGSASPTSGTGSSGSSGGVETGNSGTNNQPEASNNGIQTETSSGGIDGDTMVCEGKRAIPGLARWCQLNCQMGNCPASHCSCTTQQYEHQEPRPRGCRAAGVYATVPGMDQWCVNNCPMNCPASMCTCT